MSKLGKSIKTNIFKSFEKSFLDDDMSCFDQKSCSEHKNCSETKCCSGQKNTFDYVIVGAGNVGSVMAKRLSEDPNITVCIIESGRDDTRLPISEQGLPLPSPAPIPQPGDYNWQQYIRGGVLLFESLANRGFLDFWFYQKASPDPNSHSISYGRSSSWGGCTAHNPGSSTRQSPQNWDQWVALGLTEWSADAMIPYYQKSQNRSQIAGPEFGGFPYYSDTIPVGTMGNFDPTTDGFNGEVATLWINSAVANPPFTAAMQAAVQSLPFGYYQPPFGLMDIGTQNRTLYAQGGLGTADQTLLDQLGQITLPGTNTQVSSMQYNQILYGDNGFVYPPELAEFGFVGLAPFERLYAANTYLYSALKNPNVTIRSSSFATKILLREECCQIQAYGIEYLEGWNIYQTGRNPNALMAGYGGSPGDAKANGIEAIKRGYKKVYARRDVILSAGVFNTPQLMMCSGLGPIADLEALGIKCLKNIPGVGQNLQDNTELFVTFQTNPLANTANGAYALAAKSTTSQPFPDFEVDFVPATFGTGTTALENLDATVQHNWCGLKSGGGANNLFNRNKPDALLLDWTPGSGVMNGPNGPAFGYTAGTVSQSGNTVTGTGTDFTETLTPGTALPATVTGYYLMYGAGPTAITQNIISIESPTSLTVDGTQGLTNQAYTIYYGNGFIPRYYNPENYVMTIIEKEVAAADTGYVKLQSSDPTVPPIIIKNSTGGTTDITDVYNAAYNNWFPMLLALHNPGNPSLDFFSGLMDPMPSDVLYAGYNEFTNMNQIDPVRLMNYVTQRNGGHHASSTCKAGLESDLMAVCDPHGRVYGVLNLCIADISFSPVCLRWPQYNLFPVGERLADFNKQFWSNYSSQNSCKCQSKCKKCCRSKCDCNNTCNSVILNVTGITNKYAYPTFAPYPYLGWYIWNGTDFTPCSNTVIQDKTHIAVWVNPGGGYTFHGTPFMPSIVPFHTMLGSKYPILLGLLYNILINGEQTMADFVYSQLSQLLPLKGAIIDIYTYSNGTQIVRYSIEVKGLAKEAPFGTVVLAGSVNEGIYAADIDPTVNPTGYVANQIGKSFIVNLSALGNGYDFGFQSFGTSQSNQMYDTRYPGTGFLGVSFIKQINQSPVDPKTYERLKYITVQGTDNLAAMYTLPELVELKYTYPGSAGQVQINSIDSEGTVQTYTITAAGTGYQINSYITLQGITTGKFFFAKVTSVDLNGGITALQPINFGVGYNISDTLSINPQNPFVYLMVLSHVTDPTLLDLAAQYQVLYPSIGLVYSFSLTQLPAVKQLLICDGLAVARLEILRKKSEWYRKQPYKAAYYVPENHFSLMTFEFPDMQTFWTNLVTKVSSGVL